MGPNPEPLRWKKIVPAIALVVIAGTILTSRLGGATRSHRAGEVPHSPYVVLTSGVYQGAGWRLFAWEQQDHLCMELDPAGYSPDHRSPPALVAGAGGCEFDKRNPSSGYYDSGPGPGGSGVSFGPLPTNATQVRVASGQVLPTMPFPVGKGLPAGRYWLEVTTSGRPCRTAGTALDTPQPLDSQGHPVKFQNFR